MTSLGGLGAFAAEGPATEPDKVRFGPDIEPIVRLIEETPRGQCVAALIEQLQRGFPTGDSSRASSLPGSGD